jgi:hypothetical protein
VAPAVRSALGSGPLSPEKRDRQGRGQVAQVAQDRLPG